MIFTVGLAGCTNATRHPATHPRPVVTTGSLSGDGEVVVISRGQLVLIGASGAHERIGGPGQARQPEWSADGDWVAYLRAPPPPASEPYAMQTARLWVVRSDGTDAHALSAAGRRVEDFVWDPAARSARLAYTVAGADANGGTSLPEGLLVQGPTSSAAERLLGSANVLSFAWSPSGRQLAADAIVGSTPHSSLEVVPLDSVAAQTVFRSPGNDMHVASWWPDGKGIVFWLDYDGSSSIAADGLPLMSLNLATGRATRLATTLVHAKWLAWSPDGKTLALVAGGDRSLWDDAKHVELCTIASAKCASIGQRGGQMTLEPAWEPDGRLVVVRAPGTAANTLGPPPGVPHPNLDVPYGAQAVSAWYGAQRLWATSATGSDAQLVSAAGPGAHTPTATSHGLIYVRQDGLWYLPHGARIPVQIAAGLGAPGAEGMSYYGYVAWSSDYAWHSLPG